MKRVKVLTLMLAMILIASTVLSACAKKDNETGKREESKKSNEADKKDSTDEGKSDASADGGSKLVIWSFTDEIKNMVENYYLKDNPDLPYEVEVIVIPNEQYQTKLDPALQAGKAAPDLFAVEAAYAKKYVDSDYTMAIENLGISEDSLGDILPYVNDVVRDGNNKIKGISWQACPGALYYRRSIAQEYLGVSEPEDIQALLKDFPTFLETAERIKQGSNGAVKMVAGPGEVCQIFFANREHPWIEDGKFVIDAKIDEYFETSKVLLQNDYTAEAGQWSEGWFAGIKGNNIFGYVLPTWGLHFVLKTNCEDKDAGTTTSGDWGMVQGPGAYFNGGTWLTVREGTEMANAAKEFVEYVTLNEDFLERWAKDTGDVLANQKVVNKIKDSYSEPFLAGQNHYSEFAEMAKNVDASILTGEDLNIQTLLDEQVQAYIRDEKTKEQAIEDLKMNVQNAYPDLIVD